MASVNPTLSQRQFISYSLPEYVDEIQNKYQNKEENSARLMALALPFFELTTALKNTAGAIVRIPGCIIKIPCYLFALFGPVDSLAYGMNKKLIQMLPGPLDLIKSSVKAAFCGSAILWSPVIGAINPNLNAKIHGYLGFASPLQSKAAEFSPPIEASSGFDAIVGMDSVKNQMQAIINSLKFADVAKAYKVGIPNGVILDGPPGCGKSFFAMKFIEEAAKQLNKEVYFYQISASKTGSSLIHETSKKIAEVFEQAEKDAKASDSFAVVFIDEVDTLIAPKKTQSVSSDEERGEFLQQLEGAGRKNILVMATTNHLDSLDPAIVRAGRFDYKIHFSNPDLSMRKNLLEQLFKEIPMESSIDLSKLAEKLEGWSMAEIKASSERARLLAFQSTIISRTEDANADLVPISEEMIEVAFEKIAESSKNKPA